jgi:hypothetical protein
VASGQKLLQNRVAESGLTLPITTAYALLVWVLAGLVTQGWWVQLACLTANIYAMMELSNSNALLRVRSRMVSTTFLVLSCAASFLFPSLRGSLFSLLFTVALIPLFRSYQNPNGQGDVFFAFFFIGAASLCHVHIFYFVPVLWILMFFNLQALNSRSWMATLIGLLTPYWFLMPWVVFTDNWQLAFDHFAPLADFRFPIRYTLLNPPPYATILFIVVMSNVGLFNFINKSFEDRIRIRQLYSFFATLGWCAFAFFLFQPQHYDLLVRMMIITASPFVAHFFTHTGTKFTNILFVASAILIVLLAIINL